MRDLLFGLFVVCCVASQVWPGYAWFGNRITPFVLGVPFSLAWVVGWVLLSFIALLAYHVTGRSGTDRG